MIKEPVLEALNKQITNEMYSSNLYLAMVSYFSSTNLNGFANWMRVQAQEETFHAMKLFDYVLSRAGKNTITAIPAPPTIWNSPLEAFLHVYKHELSVTESINSLYELSIKEKDNATSILLQWFVTEQVEEEANVLDIVERIKMLGENQVGILFIDSELKKRIFTPSTTQE